MRQKLSHIGAHGKSPDDQSGTNKETPKAFSPEAYQLWSAMRDMGELHEAKV